MQRDEDFWWRPGSGAISMGWLSHRYSPQSGNPDVWHVDEFEMTAEYAQDPEGAGVQVMSDIDHLEGPGPSMQAAMDVESDPAWRAWRDDFIRDNYFLIFIEDREKLRFMHRKPDKDGMCSTTCYAPVDLYLGLKSERDVTRELMWGLYAYAAQKRGWPEPPPLPPYHDGT